jgi:hypothetical protein
MRRMWAITVCSPRRTRLCSIANLPALEAPLQSGCVVILEEARIRIRTLPIGGE